MNRFLERSVRVVAQATAAYKLLEELLVKHDAGAEREERDVRGGSTEALRHTLLRAKAMAVLQRLRLQLEHRGPACLRQRRRSPKVVEAARRHGPDLASVL